jgi:hypothetical protein
MYLHRLPQFLGILLCEVEHGDLRALAARANRLWACHGKQQQEIVALETEGDTKVVAAIRGQGSSGRPEKKASQQKKSQQDQQAAKGKTRPTDLAHSLQASVSLTGTLVRRPGSVSSPASGRKTRQPGVCKPCG